MGFKKTVILAALFFGIFAGLYGLRLWQRSAMVTQIEAPPSFGRVSSPASPNEVRTGSGAHDAEIARRPASERPESLLEKTLSPRLLKDTEIRSLDVGPHRVRLGLFRDSLYVESSDFHFEEDEDGRWNLKSGAWIYGEVNFPPLRSSLRSEVAEAIIAPAIPQNSENISMQKIRELWTVLGDEAIQSEIWKVQYRAPTEGLRRENFVIDVARQAIRTRTSALRN